MMSAHLLEYRLKRVIGDLIERRLLNAETIKLHYVDKLAGTAGYDRNDEDTYPAREQKTVELGAFVHIVSVRTTQRQFTELRTGDAIVTFEGDVDFSDKDELRFEFRGGVWVQQAVGKDLALYWDAIAGEPITKTIVLRTST
jgi:hypothetical protein